MQQKSDREPDIIDTPAPATEQHRKPWEPLHLESMPVRDTKNNPGGGADSNTSAS